MIPRSWTILVLSAAFAVFFIVNALAQASDGGISIGMAGGGYGTLGNEPMPMDNSLNIDTYPSGASMFLLEDDTKEATDEILITASGKWKLTVEEINAGTNKGKMRKYNEDGYSYPEISLYNKFGVLVNEVGENGASGGKFNTLTNAIDLADPVDIVKHDGEFIGEIDLMYSQNTDSDEDVGGRYRIELKFTLSPNYL